ncbi:MAG: MFS transporter [Trueperaceae bacterium]
MARGRAALGEVLANRDFRILWSGVVTSQIGDWLHLTALGWYVLELGGNAASVANIMAAGLLPQLLLTLIGGVAADRWPKRQVLLAIGATQLVVSAAFAGLVITSSLNVTGLTVFAFLLGCLAALWQPVYLSYIPELVPSDRLDTAMGLSLSALHTARTVGPALAGVLIGLIGTQPIFLLNAASFLAPVLVLLRLTRDGEPPERRASPLKHVRQGFAGLCEDPVLLGLWLSAVALSLLALPFLALVPVYAQDVFLRGPGALGLLMSAIGVGQLVGAAIISLGFVESVNRSGLFQLTGYLLMGVLLTLFARAPSVAFAAALLFGFNLLHGLLSPRVNAIVQRRMGARDRGTGQALFLLVFGLVPLGQVALGALAVRAGVVPATTAFGVVFTLVIALLIAVAGPLRRYNVPDAERPAAASAGLSAPEAPANDD